MAEILVPKRILAVSSHEDDVIFKMGGSLAEEAENGNEIVDLIISNGMYGVHKPELLDALELNRNLIITTREDEERLAARRIGITNEVVFFGFPDTELAYFVPEITHRLTELLIEYRPDEVWTTDPHYQYVVHDEMNKDHLQEAKAVENALRELVGLNGQGMTMEHKIAERKALMFRIRELEEKALALEPIEYKAGLSLVVAHALTIDATLPMKTERRQLDRIQVRLYNPFQPNREEDVTKFLSIKRYALSSYDGSQELYPLVLESDGRHIERTRDYLVSNNG